MSIWDVLFAFAGGVLGFGLGWMALSARVAGSSARTAALNEMLEQVKSERTQFHERAVNAEKQQAVLQQEMANWEKLKDQMLKAATASVMESGSKLSNKLLEDHKREAEAAKKDAEEQVKKTTADMLKQVNTLAEKVGGINEQQGNVQKQFQNVTRMLSNPHGAGSLSEVGLENALKSLGLMNGTDFNIQYTISSGESQGLRPDCIIYLPQDSVMVVDSKSSKLLGEFAEIDTPEKEKAIIHKLADSMNQHLKKLAAKNYQDAIYKEYKSAGRSKDISIIWNVMYVPSEGVIEKILSVDAGFRQKCLDEHIILAGPAGLYSLLLMAARQVELARQSESSHQILEAVDTLVDRFAGTLAHLSKFSSQFKTAAGTFEKVTGSINRTLLPKFAELSGYGISAAKHKEIPLKLPGFEVRTNDEALMIEGEVEDIKAVIPA